MYTECYRSLLDLCLDTKIKQEDLLEQILEEIWNMTPHLFLQSAAGNKVLCRFIQRLDSVGIRIYRINRSILCFIFHKNCNANQRIYFRWWTDLCSKLIIRRTFKKCFSAIFSNVVKNRQKMRMPVLKAMSWNQFQVPYTSPD